MEAITAATRAIPIMDNRTAITMTRTITTTGIGTTMDMTDATGKLLRRAWIQAPKMRASARY